MYVYIYMYIHIYIYIYIATGVLSPGAAPHAAS